MTAMRSATPNARSRSCDDDQRRDVDAVLEFQNLLAHHHGGQRVQFAGRLVVKNQLRLHHERAGDGDALFHAAGKVAGHFVHSILETHVFEFFSDNFSNFLRGFQPVFAQIKPDIFADGQGIQQRAGLEHQRHAVLCRDLRRLDWFAVDQNFPRVRALQAR